MQVRILSLFLAAGMAAALTACSGGKNSSSSTTTTTTTTQSSPAAAGASPAASPAAGTSPAASPAAPAASPAATGGGAMMGSHHLAASPAPIPASLHCPGGQPPVWVNMRSHAYHVASDPMYGRTLHGSYMCLTNAVNSGFHAAGHRHGGAEAEPSPSPSM